MVELCDLYGSGSVVSVILLHHRKRTTKMTAVLDPLLDGHQRHPTDPIGYNRAPRVSVMVSVILPNKTVLYVVLFYLAFSVITDVYKVHLLGTASNHYTVQGPTLTLDPPCMLSNKLF